MYFAPGDSTNAILGEFNPGNPSSQQSISIADLGGRIFVDSHDHIWLIHEVPPMTLGGVGTVVLQCYQALQATPVLISLSDASDNSVDPFVVGSDGAGNMW